VDYCNVVCLGLRSTVGRDSFLSPKTPKIQVFRGYPAPVVAQPYILGDTTRPRHITRPSLIEIGSKTAEKNSAQTHKPTDTTKIMVTWPRTNYYYYDIACIQTTGTGFILHAPKLRVKIHITCTTTSLNEKCITAGSQNIQAKLHTKCTSTRPLQKQAQFD